MTRPEKAFAVPLTEAIPPGYRRQFILITPISRQEIVVTAENGLLCYFTAGDDPYYGVTLDWIHESIEWVRADLEDLAG